MRSHSFNRRHVGALFGLLLTASMGFYAGESHGQNIARERAQHPRISSAISAIQDARTYMNNSPDNFGGHKAAAINACDTALTELRAALAFRAVNGR